MGLRSRKIDSDNIQVSSNKKNKDDIRLGSDKYWSPSSNDQNPSVTIKFDCKPFYYSIIVFKIKIKIQIDTK